MTERSLVLVKPDGYARGLTGEVLRRIEAKGYTLVALDIFTPDRERLERHYAEHEGKPFYEPLVEFMSSGPVDRRGHRGPPLHRGLPARWPAPPTRRPRCRARSAATWAATGA